MKTITMNKMKPPTQAIKAAINALQRHINSDSYPPRQKRKMERKIADIDAFLKMIEDGDGKR